MAGVDIICVNSIRGRGRQPILAECLETISLAALSGDRTSNSVRELILLR